MSSFALTFFAPVATMVVIVALMNAWDRMVRVKRPKWVLARILFNGNFRTRHPTTFVFAWLAVIALWFLCDALVYVAEMKLKQPSDSAYNRH